MVEAQEHTMLIDCVFSERGVRCSCVWLHDENDGLWETTGKPLRRTCDQMKSETVTCKTRNPFMEEKGCSNVRGKLAGWMSGIFP